MGAQGYQRFPLSKPLVLLEYSFTCCVYLQSNYLPSFCLPSSVRFNFSKFLRSSTVECVLNSRSEFSLVVLVGIHFVSPSYDLSRLTGRKTSSIYLSIYLLTSNICPWSSSPGQPTPLKHGAWQSPNPAGLQRASSISRWTLWNFPSCGVKYVMQLLGTHWSCISNFSHRHWSRVPSLGQLPAGANDLGLPSSTADVPPKHSSWSWTRWSLSLSRSPFTLAVDFLVEDLHTVM